MNERAKDINPLKSKVEQLENLIDDLEAKVEDLTDELEVTTESEKMVDLSTRIGAFNDDIELAFSKLEELVPELDEKNAVYDEKIQDLESRFLR